MIYNVKKQKNNIFKNVSASIHSPSSVLKISKNKLFSYKKRERKSSRINYYYSNPTQQKSSPVIIQ